MIEFLTQFLPRWLQPRKILALRQRASQWRALRAEHLTKEPRCRACGRDVDVIVHHVIPVSFDERRELDPENLVTLCATPCHLVFGHFMNYQCYNKDVRKMASDYRKAMLKRKCLRAELRFTTYADRSRHL